MDPIVLGISILAVVVLGGLFLKVARAILRIAITVLLFGALIWLLLYTGILEALGIVGVAAPVVPEILMPT